MKFLKTHKKKIAATVVVGLALIYGIVFADLNVSAALHILLNDDTQALLLECLGG